MVQYIEGHDYQMGGDEKELHSKCSRVVDIYRVKDCNVDNAKSMVTRGNLE